MLSITSKCCRVFIWILVLTYYCLLQVCVPIVCVWYDFEYSESLILLAIIFMYTIYMCTSPVKHYFNVVMFLVHVVEDHIYLLYIFFIH